MPPTNIILISSDQHRFDCIGANGHPLLRTPNLDRMAAEGINFTHAFTPIPLCTPARNCLLSGQWSSEHLAIANYDTEAPRAMRPGVPTFSRLLREAGYWLGYVGKWHVDSQHGPEHYGWNEYVPEGRYFRWRSAQGLPDQPRDQQWFGQADPHIAPDQSKLAWGADHLIRMLDQRAAGSAPFFLRWDPSEPHLANRPPEPYASMYPPDRIEPWPSFGETFEGKPWIQAQQLRTWQLDQWTWEDWAPVVSRYLGEISLMDAQIGRVIDALQRLGIADDTLLIYTTDHGDMCGGHRMIDKHFIMYDDVVRVPLLVRWPARVRPGVCPAFVPHFIDLPTTFCELAGIDGPDTFRGRSLLPILDGAVDNGRTDIFSAYHGNQFGLFSQRMVRDRRWKYVWNATAPDEFYDLQSDPAELHNLAARPAHTAELDRLRRRLVWWMDHTNDALLNPWTRRQIEEGLTR